MKLSRQILEQIIKEEVAAVLNEGPFDVEEPREQERVDAPQTPAGLEKLKPGGSVQGSMQAMAQIIMTHQVQFSGPEKIMFFEHLKALIESFIETEATAEMSLRRGLSMADKAAEEINQRK
jgi:hypothetical protein